jgi:hypothetical protein
VKARTANGLADPLSATGSDLNERQFDQADCQSDEDAGPDVQSRQYSTSPGRAQASAYGRLVNPASSNPGSSGPQDPRATEYVAGH